MSMELDTDDDGGFLRSLGGITNSNIIAPSNKSYEVDNNLYMRNIINYIHPFAFIISLVLRFTYCSNWFMQIH